MAAHEPFDPNDPKGEQQSPRMLRVTVILWLIAISGILFSVPLYLTLSTIRDDVDRLYANLQVAKATLIKGVTPEPSVQELADELVRVRDALNEIEVVRSVLVAERVDWPAVMTAFGNYDPSQLELAAVVHSDGRVILSGRALDEAVVVGYSRGLEISGLFSRVDVQSMRSVTTPAAAPTETSSATVLPIATVTSSMTPKPSTATPSPTRTPVPTSSPTRTPVPTISFPTRTPVPTSSPTGTPVSTSPPTPAPTSTSTRMPSPTATPEASPIPTPAPGDAYEPDDTDPNPIGVRGEKQRHSFCPNNDVDMVKFRARSGNWYRISTSRLSPGVDTALIVVVDGITYTNDDRGSAQTGDGSSEVTFRVETDYDVWVRVQVINLGQYGPDKWYDIGVEETVPLLTPTPTPTGISWSSFGSGCSRLPGMASLARGSSASALPASLGISGPSAVEFVIGVALRKGSD